MPPAAGGALGGAGVAGLRDINNTIVGGGESVEEKLKGAPADVLAAAQRLSLIPTGPGMRSSAAKDDGVVRTAPGFESTDTGELSVSGPWSLTGMLYYINGPILMY